MESRNLPYTLVAFVGERSSHDDPWNVQVLKLNKAQEADFTTATWCGPYTCWEHAWEAGGARYLINIPPHDPDNHGLSQNELLEAIRPAFPHEGASLELAAGCPREDEAARSEVSERVCQGTC